MEPTAVPHAQYDHEWEKRSGGCRTCQRFISTSRIQPRGTSACLGRLSCVTSGGPLSSSVGTNSSWHLVSQYEEQSGESVTDNVRQAVFQAGIKDASIRDLLALHAGRLNSFDKMATEVSTVVRTRNENDIVPMDVSVLKSKGRKGKDGKGKDGNTKSNANKDKKCFDGAEERTTR